MSNKIIKYFAVSLGLLAAAMAGPAMAARWAFVVGNDAYQSIDRLKNAALDAKAVSESLREAGYETTLVQDADLKKLKDDLRNFRQKIQGGDEVVFFFSGHGVNLDGQNYLLPVDVRASSADQVRDDALAVSQVLADIRSMRPAFTLAILDACRNNPFQSTGRSLGGRGLAAPSGASGEMILYAAGEGQQALDRLGSTDPVPNGVFTRVFLKEMKRPGLSVDQVLRNVRTEVYRLGMSVNHEQVPAIYDQVIGQYFFFPTGAGTVSAASALPPLVSVPSTVPTRPPVVVVKPPSSTTPTRPALRASSNEVGDWEVARNARSAVALDLFISKYPDSRFTDTAKLMRQKFNHAPSVPRAGAMPTPFQ